MCTFYFRKNKKMIELYKIHKNKLKTIVKELIKNNHNKKDSYCIQQHVKILI